MSKAVLFGLNYSKCERVNKLNGCINDVMDMRDYLTSILQIPCDVYTDDGDDIVSTSKEGIKQRLVDLAKTSHDEQLKFALIHYSGHGSYVLDQNNDERDGYDECIVPSDCDTNGLLLDDEITEILCQFNPKTRIVCIFDSCHSGTVCDMKYSWESSTKVYVENILCKIHSKVISISGCLDQQTSADAYIANTHKYSGALTNTLLNLLKSDEGSRLRNNVFSLVDELRKSLAYQGFPQRPKLCSTYNLTKNKKFI